MAGTPLKPNVDDETVWTVRHHTMLRNYHYFGAIGVDPNLRDRYADSPYFGDAA